jgi:hypothetical protein
MAHGAWIDWTRWCSMAGRDSALQSALHGGGPAPGRRCTREEVHQGGPDSLVEAELDDGVLLRARRVICRLRRLSALVRASCAACAV